MSMRQVAQMAGVSTSTVSRVLNERPNVAADTVAAVRRAVQDLQFRPVLRRSRTANDARAGLRYGTVAFVMFGADDTRRWPILSKLLRGVSNAMESLHLNLLFTCVSKVSELPPRMLDGSVDGVLLNRSIPNQELEDTIRSFPAVWLMAGTRQPLWGDQVMPDNTGIGETAAAYLKRFGHRHVAYLGTGQGSWSLAIRALSFSRAAYESGMTATVINAAEQTSTPFSLQSADGWMKAAKLVVDRLRQIDPRPTGLFVAEDQFLPGIDAALQAHGLSTGPGGAVQIISCNNERPYLAGLRTEPATIEINAESIGWRAVEQLVWRVRNPDVADRIRTMVAPTLIEPQGHAEGP